MPANSTPEKTRIQSIFPPAAIPGGLLEVRGQRVVAELGVQPEVHFGSVAGRVVIGASNRLVVSIPDETTDNNLQVVAGKGCRAKHSFSLGKLLANNIHAVANPVIDAKGNIFTTYSGPRGKKTHVSVYKIDNAGQVEPFLTGITNATGLLVHPDGNLLVSSRNNGMIYCVTPDGKMDVFAEGMGVATGLAIDKDRNVYVGDRTGTIFKINSSRDIFVFATLEPSVAAYHLAMHENGSLYASSPTTSSYNSVHVINPQGEVSIFRRGFGRPQGIAIDKKNRLHLCASYRGQYGIFRLLDDEKVEHIVSGIGIVGLAFTQEQDIIVTTSSCAYHIADPG